MMVVDNSILTSNDAYLSIAYKINAGLRSDKLCNANK